MSKYPENMSLVKLTVFVILLGFLSTFVVCKDDTDAFDEFIKQYKKTYRNDTKEYWKRFEIFEKNVQHHAFLNAGRNHPASALYGITKFSDLTQEEFQRQYLSHMSMKSNYTRLPDNFFYVSATGSQDVPDKKDWRTANAVTSVKDQKSCGACWAFSTVAAVESMRAIGQGILESLSVQQVIDCSYGYKTWLNGCKGGEPCTAMEWMQAHALVTEAAYPTKDKVQTCQVGNKTSGVLVKSHKCYDMRGHEDLLVQLIATHGPVAVSVDATSWNNYQGGIIQYHCGTRYNNHAVEIIGYDKTGPIPYYIAKNSWGTNFGNDGYVNIMIGGNVCGIADGIAAAYL